MGLRNPVALFFKTISSVISIALLILFLFLIANKMYNHYFSKSTLIDIDATVSKNCHLSAQHKDTVKILIIDGGGIQGIMPLMILSYLEQQSGKPAAELFDFFAGVSTGAIIVSALNTPTPEGKPKFSAKQVIELYIRISKTVMSSPIHRRILTINGLLGPKLSGKLLYQEFIKELGNNLIFHRLIKNVAITSYNLSTSQLDVFENWDCSQPQRNYPVAALLAAATSTPSMFPPVVFKDEKHGIKNTYVDGMVFANNPSLFALKEVFYLYPNAKKYIVVHLGTGTSPAPNLRRDDIAEWGLFEWALPLASIFYESRGEDLSVAMRSIKKLAQKNQFEEFYFNDLIYQKDPFDNSEQNINMIKRQTSELIAQRKTQLDYLATILSK